MLRASIIGIGLLLAVGVTAAAPAADLTIWWTKGFYPAQDEGITRAAEQFQKDTGTTVELDLYTQKDIPIKLQAALEAGQPPDVYDDAGDARLTNRWALEGHFLDLTDLVEPLAKSIDPTLLRQAYLLNGRTGKPAYYSLPLETLSNHIHVWRSLLDQAGIGMDQIPHEWSAFWDFFCDTVQPAVRTATGRRDIYGMGLPSSTVGDDTSTSFMEFQLAHDAWFVDDHGKLLLDQPGMRQRLIETLQDFARFSKKGCNPPGAVSWGNPDNNVNFLNQAIVMTPNTTLSIPGSRRTSNPEDYYRNIVTIAWPNTIAGKPLPVTTGYVGAEIYAQGRNPEAAKAFLRDLVQPERLGPYIEAAQGRYFPAMRELAERPFWTDPGDPHVTMLRRQMASNPQQQDWGSLNPKFEKVYAEMVWPKAIDRIILENWTAEQAADEAIARTKEIVGQ